MMCEEVTFSFYKRSVSDDNQSTPEKYSYKGLLPVILALISYFCIRRALEREHVQKNTFAKVVK